VIIKNPVVFLLDSPLEILKKDEIKTNGDKIHSMHRKKEENA
jgi:hypothetical protein